MRALSPRSPNVERHEGNGANECRLSIENKSDAEIESMCDAMKCELRCCTSLCIVTTLSPKHLLRC